jgi:hypothetical protein
VRLRDIARPLDGAAGYDYPAIARALTRLQRQVLAEIAAEAIISSETIAHGLVEAGLAVAGDPPVLSMLGEAVIEHGLAGAFDA